MTFFLVITGFIGALQIFDLVVLDLERLDLLGVVGGVALDADEVAPLD